MPIAPNNDTRTRQPNRITAPHRIGLQRLYSRSTRRTSQRLKTIIPIQCGPQETDRPGWMEADTVQHGGGSSSGQLVWSLTLTNNYSGWTELSALWGDSGGKVCTGLRRIGKRMPYAMPGFDCDNGSEFLNTVVGDYLSGRGRDIKWTRSRLYKKNDLAHVDQKNFTPVMKLVEKTRIGIKEQPTSGLVNIHRCNDLTPSVSSFIGATCMLKYIARDIMSNHNV